MRALGTHLFGVIQALHSRAAPELRADAQSFSVAQPLVEDNCFQRFLWQRVCRGQGPGRRPHPPAHAFFGGAAARRA